MNNPTGDAEETPLPPGAAGSAPGESGESGEGEGGDAPPPVEEILVEQAAEMARRAGDLTLNWFRRAALDVDAKQDGSPVTEADRAAESFLRAQLADRHPADGMVGEEHGVTPGRSGRTWFIDPIDGTESFIRGIPLYATLLALRDEHGMAVGVINLPALGNTVAAGRGRGCFLNGSPARVSDRSAMEGAMIATTGFDLLRGEVAERLHGSPAKIRGWGDAYGYSLVATGAAEAMYDPIAAPWDLAPMAVIIPEAGGIFTDRNGVSDFRAGSGLASNGLLHQPLLELVSRRPGDPNGE